jgi:hypothetical protein
MPPRHGRRYRRDRLLSSSPEPPLRVVAAGRWVRPGPSPPEFVRTIPRVPATPDGTLGASVVTSGGHQRAARPRAETSARRDLSRRDGPDMHAHTPGRPVLGASRRTLVAPGSGACATDSSRARRPGKPIGCSRARSAARTGGGVRHQHTPRRTGHLCGMHGAGSLLHGACIARHVGWWGAVTFVSSASRPGPEHPITELARQIAPFPLNASRILLNSYSRVFVEWHRLLRGGTDSAPPGLLLAGAVIRRSVIGRLL